MMALFGGIAHAPLAVMLMVAEMTGNLSLLAPAMIAVGISSIIVGNSSIYTSQVDTRADSPAHRLQFSFPLLNTLTVRQAMVSPPLHFSTQQSVGEAMQLLSKQKVSGASVLDSRGDLQGVLTLADIERVPPDELDSRTIEQSMNKDVLVIRPDETLDAALEQLTSHHVGWMPVVEINAASGGRREIGRITAQDISRAYHASLGKGAKQMRNLAKQVEEKTPALLDS